MYYCATEWEKLFAAYGRIVFYLYIRIVVDLISWTLNYITCTIYVFIILSTRFNALRYFISMRCLKMVSLREWTTLISKLIIVLHYRRNKI